MKKRPTLSTRERMRLGELHGWRCCLCNHPINPVKARWQIHHVRARELFDQRAGEDPDTDENMKPVHYLCHKKQTAKEDIPRFAKAKRQEARHYGAKRSKNPLPGGRDDKYKRKIGGKVVLR